MSFFTDTVRSSFPNSSWKYPQVEFRILHYVFGGEENGPQKMHQFATNTNLLKASMVWCVWAINGSMPKGDKRQSH